MKINKTGYYFLNALLLSAIIAGQYEWLEPRTVIQVLVVPAFIISASLRYGVKKKDKEVQKKTGS